MAFNFLKNLFSGGDTVDNLVETDGPQYANLSGAAFRKALKESKKAVLLDVRTPAEFAQGAIPGAKNIDFLSPSFAGKIKNLDKDVTYFLYCRSGARSAQAGKQMNKLGFDVRNLSGGIGAF